MTLYYLDDVQLARVKAKIDAMIEAAGGSYTLPVATTSTLGGVKVGAGLAVEADGTLSAAEVDALTDAEVHAITGGTGYDDGDEVSY